MAAVAQPPPPQQRVIEPPEQFGEMHTVKKIVIVVERITFIALFIFACIATKDVSAIENSIGNPADYYFFNPVVMGSVAAGFGGFFLVSKLVRGEYERRNWKYILFSTLVFSTIIILGVLTTQKLISIYYLGVGIIVTLLPYPFFNGVAMRIERRNNFAQYALLRLQQKNREELARKRCEQQIQERQAIIAQGPAPRISHPEILSTIEAQRAKLSTILS